MVTEAEASGEGVPGADVCLIMPLPPPPPPGLPEVVAAAAEAAASCCISAVAFLLLSFLQTEQT